MDNGTNQVTPTGQISSNELWRYVQDMESSMVARLSQPASPEVMQLMEQNIQSMLGVLPTEGFDVMISTDREQLGRLLASAMMNGYFLKTAEQRMALEKSTQSFSIDESTDI
ncbi:MAG: DUF760 domain-containing protein [Cyanobacteria bacterium P01_F01_bin.42]